MFNKNGIKVENNDWKTLKGEDVKHRNILENIMKNVNNHGDI